MWHILQVHSPEKSKKQHIMRKLQPFPIGIPKFNETYRVKNKTHQDTKGKNNRLRGSKILELH